MTSAPSCPPSDKVQDLLANRLPLDEAATIRQHLRDCPLCRKRLQLDSGSESRYPFLGPPQQALDLGWLEPYRIVGVLGEGGMAIVFDAEDTALNRRVALKVLRPDLVDANLRARFFHEAKLLASLSQENIVSIYQVGEANGICYLAMERLEGLTLHEKLKQDHWLPLAEALSLARQAAEGLAVLHQHALVHRDVKPANLWLEMRKGQLRRIKLIDFGIARRVDESSQLTQPGQIVGTLVYMAPEQAQGLKVDGRTDLFSLGCVLYHMLTGHPPLGGKKSQTQTLLKEIIRGQTMVVRDKAPQVPPPVARLIEELLARKPEDRPASAAIVADRLRQLEQGLRTDMLPHVPAHAAPEIRRTVHRHSSLGIWLGGATLLLAVIVAVVFGWYKIFSPPTSSDKDQQALQNNPQSSGSARTGNKLPLKVGILHSLSGYLSSRERPIVHALQLAIEEINERGGAMGRTLVPFEADGASDPEKFAIKARQLISEDKVDVLFGCWSSASRKRVYPICEEHDRLLFYPTADEGLEDSPAVVYLGGTPNQTAVPTVRWAVEQNKRRMYLVGTEDVYSRGMQAILEHQITSDGGTLVGKTSVSVGQSVFGQVVQEIRSKQPDLILNTSNGHDLVPFFKALRGVDLAPPKTPTIWFSLSENELGQFPIESLKGDYAVACYFGSSKRQESQEFLERYRKRFGSKERVNDDMQTAYFGVYLWKQAVEKAGTTEFGSVRRELRGMTVVAPEGPIRIDSISQHAERTWRLGEIVDSRPLPEFRTVDRSERPLDPDPFPAWRSRVEWDTFLKDLYVNWGDRWEKFR